MAARGIVNFECPVTKGNEKPIIKQGPNLQCSEKGVEAVKWAGFDCVTLANNHFLDYGEDGVKNALEACKRYGLDTVGGGLCLKDASSILYKDIDGERLAVINCCEHEFSIATANSAGCNPLNTIQQYYAIQEAKRNADFVLVIVHGGHEHFQLPSPRMKETYRFFIDAGADAIVNHHQHCFSGFETYKDRPIFYGLGNLCFDKEMRKSCNWYEGYMVMVEFSDGHVRTKLYPYHQSETSAKVEMMAEDAYKGKIERLNAIIKDPDKTDSEIEKYYASRAVYVETMFEPLMNKYFRTLKKKGWLPSLISLERLLLSENFISCESHRDIVTWLLKKNRQKREKQ